MSATDTHGSGGAPLRVFVVVGNPKPRSRTLEVTQAVAGRLRDAIASGVSEIETVDLADHVEGLFDPDSKTVGGLIDEMVTADPIVVGSPTYRATYTGILKVFLDRLGGGRLAGKVAVPVMVAGAAHHALAVETYLRPLLVELGATCPTPGLCVLESELVQLDQVIDVWWSKVSAPLRHLCVTTD